MIVLDSYEFGWLVGILEGEGSFIFHKSSSVKYDFRQWTIQAVSTDEEIIDRLCELMHANKTGPYTQPNPAHSAYWRMQISRRKEVLDWCAILYPEMSTRRKAQIQALFNADKLYPVRPFGPKAKVI